LVVFFVSFVSFVVNLDFTPIALQTCARPIALVPETD